MKTLPYQFQPIARIGECEEIAERCCSSPADAASYITGTELLVDGGRSRAGSSRGCPAAEPRRATATTMRDR